MKKIVIGFYIFLMSVCFAGAAFAVEKPDEGFGSVKIITEEGGINLSGTAGESELGLVDAVGGLFNWVLSIMGLIALVMVMWGGFRMLTAGGDEDSYSKGFTVLKNAAIGLAIIGLAWFVVSLFFYITNLLTDS